MKRKMFQKFDIQLHIKLGNLYSLGRPIFMKFNMQVSGAKVWGRGGRNPHEFAVNKLGGGG